MSNIYQFKCGDCGYETMSSMSDDRGFNNSFSPMICTKCETLENRITGSSRSRGGVINPTKPICEGCNLNDYLVVWNSCLCPKCHKNSMETIGYPICRD